MQSAASINKTRQFIIITSLILSIQRLVYAQHPAFYQLNNENGAPSNEIYRVVQDSFGYIWIGCDAGLFQYDGFTYKQYSNNQQNGRGISFLQIDSKQRIWCKNFFGQIYRTDDDSLKLIKSITTSDPAYPQFTTDKYSNLWYYDNKQLIKCDENGKEITKLPYKQLSITGNVIAIKYFKENIYILTNELSLYQLELETNKINLIQWDNKKLSVSYSASFIEHNNKLHLFVAFENSEQKYALFYVDKNEVKIYKKLDEYNSNKRIYSVYSDKKSLWITTSEGAKKIDNQSASSALFKNEKISCMLLDRENQYWFSTLHNGVYVVPNLQIIKINSLNSQLIDNNISIVKAFQKNKLLLGTYSGRIIEHDINNNLSTEVYAEKKEFILNVKAIEKKNGYTIVSRGRLCVIDSSTGIQHFPKLSNVRDITITEDSVILVFPNMIATTTLKNLISENEPKCLKIKSEGGKSVAYNPVQKLLYFSMGNGLFVRDYKGNWDELTYHSKKLFASTLKHQNGIIWVATVSNGVIGIKGRTIVYHFNKTNYLKDNNTRTINVSRDYLWVCTENYLHRIDFKKNQTAVFDISNQINSKDINSIDVLNGNVYLGTNKGLIYFPENISWKNEIKPNIKLLSAGTNNLNSNIEKRLALDYNNNNIKITFSSTALKSKGNFYYKYKLIGLDTNYTVIPASTNHILFSRIPSGDFELEIIAINEHGIESNSIKLPISVSIPFWQQWWFYIFIAIIFSGIVAIFFTTRIRYIKNKAEQKNQMISSQLTALKSQMNPHFLFNTLNSIQDLILKQDIKNTNYYLSKYGMLMRKILEISEKNEIPLSEEMELLDTYLQLEKLRFGDDFHFNITKSNEITSDNYFVPPMVIQPFIENAIKHGLMHKRGNKTLTINFILDSNDLICIIDDNGIGRKKSTEINKKQQRTHQSFATNATEKRISLLNSFSKKQYKFEIIDKELKGESSGTQIIIRIPNSIS